MAIDGAFVSTFLYGPLGPPRSHYRSIFNLVNPILLERAIAAFAVATRFKINQRAIAALTSLRNTAHALTILCRCDCIHNVGLRWPGLRGPYRAPTTVFGPCCATHLVSFIHDVHHTCGQARDGAFRDICSLLVSARVWSLITVLAT